MSDEPTIREKRRYICENIHKLYRDRKNMIDIGKTLQRAGCIDKVKDNAEGCIVNLDTIGAENDAVVSQMYVQVKHKIEKLAKKK